MTSDGAADDVDDHTRAGSTVDVTEIELVTATEDDAADGDAVGCTADDVTERDVSDDVPAPVGAVPVLDDDGDDDDGVWAEDEGETWLVGVTAEVEDDWVGVGEEVDDDGRGVGEEERAGADIGEDVTAEVSEVDGKGAGTEVDEGTGGAGDEDDELAPAAHGGPADAVHGRHAAIDVCDWRKLYVWAGQLTGGRAVDGQYCSTGQARHAALLVCCVWELVVPFAHATCTVLTAGQ
jgi:hypothetical protein